MPEDHYARALAVWGPEIVARRKDEPPEITELWRHARNTNPWSRQKPGKNWDGKPKKERPQY